MAAAWPNTLPNFLETDGYNHAIGDTTIRTTMDVGLDKLRKRFTKSIDTTDGNMKLDRTQYLTLDTFYKTTLNGGTLPFEFIDPLTQVLNEYRFTKPPSARSIGGNFFNVSLNWEKMP